MKRILILAALLALAAFSGCVQQDIRPAAAKLPEISPYIQQYPEGWMTALFMNKDAVTLVIDDMRSDCDVDIPIAPYWYFTLRTDAGIFEFYIDEAVQNVLCVVEPKDLPEPGECVANSECDDADSSTKDECVGRPKKCVNTSINKCADNDGYCPEGCSYVWDNDCPAVDQCQSDFDCIDSNNLTKDTCSGTPKTCHYELKSCEELEKYLCEQYEVCDEAILPTTDRGICCAVPCSKTVSCEGVTCPEEQKCVRGNCIDKSCAERELPLCVPGEACLDEYFKDTFGIVCCTGECRRPCDSDANCDAGEVCDLIEKYCIVKSCSDWGGKTCNATTERCTGEKERTVDNEECCLECTLKTCKQRWGIVCDATKGEECSQSAVESLDEPECCLAKCKFDWCIGRRCAINKKCVEEKCILKACEEMEGIEWRWVDRELCRGKFYHTSGAWDCCIEMTCEEMNGIECSGGQICSGSTVTAGDTSACCIGSCQEPSGQGDFYLSGEPVIAGSWSDETMPATCFMQQEIFLDLYSTFSEDKTGVYIRSYVDGQSVSTYMIRTDEDGGFGTVLHPGKNRIHFTVNEFLTGHTLKIVIDSYDSVAEGNENNNELEKAFSGPKTDLVAESIEYKAIFSAVSVKIARSPVNPDCPSISSSDGIARIYIDGVDAGTTSTFGFNEVGNSKGDVWVNYTESGEHSIRVVVDPSNVFDESNESNNEFTGTLVVP